MPLYLTTISLDSYGSQVTQLCQVSDASSDSAKAATIGVIKVIINAYMSFSNQFVLDSNCPYLITPAVINWAL